MLINPEITNGDISCTKFIGSSFVNGFVVNTSFKSSEITLSSISNTIMTDNNFDNSGWVDSIINVATITGSSFENCFGTCISAINITNPSKSGTEFLQNSAHGLVEQELLWSNNNDNDDRNEDDNAELSY
jgi:hypothetical protein